MPSAYHNKGENCASYSQAPRGCDARTVAIDLSQSAVDKPFSQRMGHACGLGIISVCVQHITTAITSSSRTQTASEIGTKGSKILEFAKKLFKPRFGMAGHGPLVSRSTCELIGSNSRDALSPLLPQGFAMEVLR